MIIKHREMQVGQRTQAINALRGHAAGFGVIAAKGIAQVDALLDKLAAEDEVPLAARDVRPHGEPIATLDEQIAALNEDLAALHAKDLVSQRLAKVPGIGPVAAVTLALTVSAEHFGSGGTSPPGSASRPKSIRPAASSGRAGSAKQAMNSYGVGSSWVPPRSSATCGPTGRAPGRGW